MTSEVEAALEWFDKGLCSPVAILSQRFGNVLATEVRAQQERGCDTCEHQARLYDIPWCMHLTAVDARPIYCDDVGNTCGAWAKEKKP